MIPRARQSGLLRILPGLVLSAAAIVYLAVSVDWRATVSAWGQARYWVFLPAVACMIAAMFARAAGWRCLMGGAVSFRRSFWVLNISYLLNGLLPFRLGDVARAYLISRRDGPEPPAVTAGAALSAVALERMFDLTYTLILVAAVFPLLAGAAWGGQVLLYAVGMAVVFLAGLLTAGLLGPRILLLTEKIAVRVPILRPLLGPAAHFIEGLRQVRNFRRSLPALGFIGLGMALWAAEYWIVLAGFFPGVPLYWGILSLIGGLIGVALPSSPSSLGVFEGAVTLVLTMNGMARESAVAYAIAIHVLNIVGLMALGAVGLLAERETLGSALAAGQAPAGESAAG